MISPTWIITGASRGFGYELAAAALEAGCQVLGTARHTDALSALRELGGSRFAALAADLTVASDVARIVPAAMEAFGQVDVLLNNAGSGLVSPAEETSVDQESSLMQMHYHAPMALIRAVLPEMRDRGAGNIISFGAAATHGNYPGFAAYGAAKAALECASEALRAEVQGFGIQVSVIIPGPFRTGFITHAPAVVSEIYRPAVGRFATVLERMNGRQPGDPARAAELIVDYVVQGNLPPRLPLGAYVVKKLQDRANSSLKEIETLASVAKSADFQT